MYQCHVLSAPFGSCLLSLMLLLVLRTLKATGFRLFIDYQNQNLNSFAPYFAKIVFHVRAQAVLKITHPNGKRQALE